MADFQRLEGPKLISRKIWGTKLKFPQCVIFLFTQCGNCRNSLSHFFRKNFVKAMILLKKLLNSWFDEKNFQWERIFGVPHCAAIALLSGYFSESISVFKQPVFTLYQKFHQINFLFPEVFIANWFDEMSVKIQVRLCIAREDFTMD